MKTARFRLYRSGKSWRWRLRAANGEPYTTKRKCVRAIFKLSTWASEGANAGIEEGR